MLGGVDFLPKGFQCVFRINVHQCLIDNRSSINLRRDVMDGAPTDLHPAAPGLVEAEETRQQAWVQTAE